MNAKEYNLIASVFRNHRKMYGGRTDSVAVEIIEDMADYLGMEYPKTFDRGKFMAACGLEDK